MDAFAERASRLDGAGGPVLVEVEVPERAQAALDASTPPVDEEHRAVTAAVTGGRAVYELLLDLTAERWAGAACRLACHPHASITRTTVVYGRGMVMRRFQMMIDPELDAALDRRAVEEGVSKAELLRRFAREHVEPLPALEDDPLRELVGLVDEPDDDGERWDVDAIVYGTSDHTGR